MSKAFDVPGLSVGVGRFEPASGDHEIRNS